MPIRSIAGDIVETFCTVCGATLKTPISTLVLGHSLDGQPGSPDEIRLPVCTCGAGEILLRTHDRHPPDSADDAHNQHRRLVNALSIVLRERGQSHPTALARHGDEVAAGHRPPDLLDHHVEAIRVGAPLEHVHPADRGRRRAPTLAAIAPDGAEQPEEPPAPDGATR